MTGVQTCALPISMFSAALRCGLIEAALQSVALDISALRFPQHYAAASLKRSNLLGSRRRRVFRFPQHYAAASLKRLIDVSDSPVLRMFSAALRCGLIEAPRSGGMGIWKREVFRSITLRPH